MDEIERIEDLLHEPGARIGRGAHAQTGQIGSRDAEVDAAAITCATACNRGRCTTGPVLDRRCHACVGSICAADPFCCNGAWDSICVSEVSWCGFNCN